MMEKKEVRHHVFADYKIIERESTKSIEPME